jgi:hypothetical protein
MRRTFPRLSITSGDRRKTRTFARMAHDIDEYFLAEAAEAPCFKPLKRRERIPVTLAPDADFTGLVIPTPNEPLPEPEIIPPAAQRHNPKYLLGALGIGFGFGLALGAGLPTGHHGGVVYLPPAIPAAPPPMIIMMEDSSVSPPVTQDAKVLLFEYFEQWRQHHRQ